LRFLEEKPSENGCPRKTKKKEGKNGVVGG